MRHLRHPLGLHILVRSLTDNREANEKDVGLGVGEGAESVVIFLTCGVRRWGGGVIEGGVKGWVG